MQTLGLRTLFCIQKGICNLKHERWPLKALELRTASKTTKASNKRFRLQTSSVLAESPDGNPKDVNSFELLHNEACLKGQDSYIDPESGYTVFTAKAHLKRGNCCGAAKPGETSGRKWRCRHCPYEEDGSLGPAGHLLGNLLLLPPAMPDGHADVELQTEAETRDDAAEEESSADVDLLSKIQSIDSKLSKRRLWLDPGGYVLIRVKTEENLIEMKHIPCEVDEKTGLVVDDTGKPVSARGNSTEHSTRKPPEDEGPTVYSGSTAKEICVMFFENDKCPVKQLNHAAYIGRELARAEEALRTSTQYVQD